MAVTVQPSLWSRMMANRRSVGSAIAWKSAKRRWATGGGASARRRWTV
jgi:hypothetical protein